MNTADLLLDVVSYRPAWQAHASCRGMMHDPAAPSFFPGRGEDTRDAKAICAGCPVQVECGDYAEAFPQYRLPGVWGGGTERSRRRALATPRIEHGTNAGYAAHRRRGEVACDDCRRAHDNADRKARVS